MSSPPSTVDTLYQQAVDTLYQQAVDIWGCFDVDQFVGGLPNGVFQKAQKVAHSEEFAKTFMAMLVAKLTPAEQDKAVAHFQKQIDEDSARAAELEAMLLR